MRKIKLMTWLRVLAGAVSAQTLPARWEELTASDWPRGAGNYSKARAMR